MTRKTNTQRLKELGVYSPRNLDRFENGWTLSELRSGRESIFIDRNIF